MEIVVGKIFVDGKEKLSCYIENKQDFEAIFYVEVYQKKFDSFEEIAISAIDKSKNCKFFINKGFLSGKDKPELKRNFCLIFDKLFETIEQNGWNGEVVVNNQTLNYYTSMKEESNFYNTADYFRAFKKANEIDSFDNRFKNFPIYVDKKLVRKYINKKVDAPEFERE